jgi:hypothetical protein
MTSRVGGGQAPPPPPPSPPPPTDNYDTDELDVFAENEDSRDDVIDATMNAQFMIGVEEERAAHTAFDAEQQHRQEAVAVEE